MEGEKARVEEENAKLKMDLEIYKEKEVEYSKMVRGRGRKDCDDHYYYYYHYYYYHHYYYF